MKIKDCAKTVNSDRVTCCRRNPQQVFLLSHDGSGGISAGVSSLGVPPYALIRSSIQASSLSLGTIILLPMVMVGKSLECIRV